MDGFRKDVEGLRALAIGIVLLAHAGVAVTAGGYVGVDVFFLISGFLITRLLVGERERTGRIALPRFYARRIKRLMPQALTAIVVVAFAAPLLLSPLDAFGALDDVDGRGPLRDELALSRPTSVDYFAAGAADGPLDHFWSLAVEEQFYIVWPLLCCSSSAPALARPGAGRHRRRLARVRGAARGTGSRAGLLLHRRAGVGAGARRPAGARR